MALTPKVIFDTGRRGLLPRSYSYELLARRPGKTHCCALAGAPWRGRETGSDRAVRPVAMRGTRAAIARLPKIVDRLFHFFVLRGPDRKFHRGRWNIVGRPMVPCAGGRIGIVTEQDETLRSGRRAGPLQRRGEVVPIAGKASRNCRSIGECLEASSMRFLLQAAGDIGSGLASSPSSGSPDLTSIVPRTSSRNRTMD